MNHRLLAGGMAVAVLLASASAAFAQSASQNQAIPWQFRSADPNATAVLQNGVVLMQEMRNHTLGLTPATGASGQGGLLGASSQATNNFNQTITETVNNCSAGAAGAEVSCGGGAATSTTTQTTSASSAASSNTLTGNTIHSSPVTTTTTYNGQ